MKLSKHFLRSEFRCRCQRCSYATEPDMAREIIALAELARMYVTTIDPKGYVRVNSARRCPEHNQRVGGRSRSQHLLGTAIDITPVGKGIDIPKMYKFLCELFPNDYGFGCYKSFIHMDVRKTKARWQG